MHVVMVVGLMLRSPKHADECGFLDSSVKNKEDMGKDEL
jgi:hypothetical protein